MIREQGSVKQFPFWFSSGNNLDARNVKRRFVQLKAGKEVLVSLKALINEKINLIK